VVLPVGAVGAPRRRAFLLFRTRTPRPAGLGGWLGAIAHHCWLSEPRERSPARDCELFWGEGRGGDRARVACVTLFTHLTWASAAVGWLFLFIYLFIYLKSDRLAGCLAEVPFNSVWVSLKSEKPRKAIMLYFSDFGFCLLNDFGFTVFFWLVLASKSFLCVLIKPVKKASTTKTLLKGLNVVLWLKSSAAKFKRTRC